MVAAQASSSEPITLASGRWTRAQPTLDEKLRAASEPGFVSLSYLLPEFRERVLKAPGSKAFLLRAASGDPPMSGLVVWAETKARRDTTIENKLMCGVGVEEMGVLLEEVIAQTPKGASGSITMKILPKDKGTAEMCSALGFQCLSGADSVSQAFLH